MALALIDFVITLVLVHFRVTGSATDWHHLHLGHGYDAEKTGWYVVDPSAGVYSVFPDFSQGLQLGGLAYGLSLEFQLGGQPPHSVHCHCLCLFVCGSL